jgi:NAD-dependent SIR2 family protein deacetylase
MSLQKNVETSVDFLLKAEMLLINSDAGMEVDSDLPDFRCERGFWNAYPV